MELGIMKLLEEIWKEDKKLLNLSSSGINIDWEGKLPHAGDLYKLLLKNSEIWQSPKETLEIDSSSLNSILDFLIPQIEDIFDKRFQDFNIEIVRTKDFLPRINEIEKKLCELIGYGDLSGEAPTMYHSPTGIILVPEKYIVSYSEDGSLKNLKTVELSWDKNYFEQVLNEELTHALFRQIRGEWKENYVKSMKALGIKAEHRISVLNESIALYVREEIAKSERPEWGIHLVYDKLRRFWPDELAMNDYRAIIALLANKKLSQIAMADELIIKPTSGVDVSFDSNHPFSKEKRKFYSERMDSLVKNLDEVTSNKPTDRQATNNKFKELMTRKLDPLYRCTREEGWENAKKWSLFMDKDKAKEYLDNYKGETYGGERSLSYIHFKFGTPMEDLEKIEKRSPLEILSETPSLEELKALRDWGSNIFTLYGESRGLALQDEEAAGFLLMTIATLEAAYRFDVDIMKGNTIDLNIFSQTSPSSVTMPGGLPLLQMIVNTEIIDPKLKETLCRAAEVQKENRIGDGSDNLLTQTEVMSPVAYLIEQYIRNMG